MKRLLMLIIALFFNALVFAQESSGVEMAEGLRSSGKIYVVVASIAVIFFGIVFYLVTLDRRLSKLEKENK